MPFTLRCVQYVVTSVLLDQQYKSHVWCKKFACGPWTRFKALLMKKYLADVLF